MAQRFFIEDDQGNVTHQGDVTSIFVNGNYIKIEGALDSGVNLASYPFANPTPPYSSQSTFDDFPIEEFALEEPTIWTCKCPIRDLLSSGHLPGCPEKP